MRRKRSQVANASCCLAFLGVTEVTVPDDSSYDSSVHLSFSDIMIDDHDLWNPMVLQVSQWLALFGMVWLYVGWTGVDLCLVATMVSYIHWVEKGPGPLFQLQKSESVNKTPFCCDGEGGVGLDKEKYCSHSICIGAANTAASKGMEDCTGIIKTLGRWESVAYSQYVCIPRGCLAPSQWSWQPWDFILLPGACCIR